LAPFLSTAAVELLLGDPGLPLLPHRGRHLPAKVPNSIPGIKYKASQSHRDPWEMLKEGDFSHIELMMGTNQDEGELCCPEMDLHYS
jgi:carboxylesterase type B